MHGIVLFRNKRKKILWKRKKQKKLRKFKIIFKKIKKFDIVDHLKYNKEKFME